MTSTTDSHQVKKLTENFSEGVSKENEISAAAAKHFFSFLEQCKTPDEFYNNLLSHAKIEYSEFSKKFPAPHLKILDIGVGRGESSVFLAHQGHHVFSVEPSIDFCNLISFIKNKFKLKIDVINTVGEETDKIEEKDFDVVIFNASLHHCDNPDLALKNAFNLLKTRGIIFLSSEIQIRPWVNKKRWYWLLENFPQKMKHYGGNEHAYYSWEYVQMLKKAGFKQVKRLPSGQFLSPMYRIKYDLNAKPLAQRNLKEKTIFAIRCGYYFAMALLVRLPILYQPLSSISLLPAQFYAVKLNNSDFKTQQKIAGGT